MQSVYIRWLGFIETLKCKPECWKGSRVCYYKEMHRWHIATLSNFLCFKCLVSVLTTTSAWCLTEGLSLSKVDASINKTIGSFGRKNIPSKRLVFPEKEWCRFDEDKNLNFCYFDHLLSLILICKNQKHYLGKTSFKSVCRQTLVYKSHLYILLHYFPMFLYSFFL